MGPEMRSPRHAAAGFTLLELILAMAIVAALTAALAASLRTAFVARRSTASGLSTARAARLAIDQVARDLQSAIPPGGVLAGAFVATDTTAAPGLNGGSVTFYNLATPFRPADGASEI